MENTEIKIDYCTYEETESDEIPDNILEILRESGEIDWEDIEDDEDSIVKVRYVNSPFAIAESSFDLRECDNTLVEEGVKRTKVTTFNGGSFIIEFEKTNDISFIFQGNEEEGYNLFIL